MDERGAAPTRTDWRPEALLKRSIGRAKWSAAAAATLLAPDRARTNDLDISDPISGCPCRGILFSQRTVS